MGVFDNIKDKAQDAFGDKDNLEKAKQMAEERGITVEEAKERLNQGGNGDDRQDEGENK